MSTSSTSSDASDDATKRNDEIKIAFDSSSLDERSRITNSDKQKYLALDPRKDLVRWQQSTTDVEIFIRIPTNSSEKNGDFEVKLTTSTLGVRLKGHAWGNRADVCGGVLFRTIKLDESSWTRDTDELYFCLRKDKDIVWESIFEDDHAHRKLPHEILKDMVDADEGCKKKPYEDLSMESKILVEEMRERMRMLASKEISIEDLEGDKFVIGEV
ncbi:unnamed protein product [Bathycoccus prasinos]